MPLRKLKKKSVKIKHKNFNANLNFKTLSGTLSDRDKCV